MLAILVKQCGTAMATLILLLCMAIQPVAAKINVMSGTDMEKDKLKKMLKDASGVDVNIGADGSVTLGGAPTNEFGKRLKEIIDSAAEVKLKLERQAEINGKTVKHKLAAWDNNDPEKPGDGTQRLDVCDLEMLPKRPKGAPGQEAVLIHELTEAHVGAKDGVKYDAAHKAAMLAESAVMTEINDGKATIRLASIHGFKRDGEGSKHTFAALTATAEEASAKGIEISYDKDCNVTTTNVGNYNLETGKVGARLGIGSPNDVKAAAASPFLNNAVSLPGANDVAFDNDGNVFASDPTANVVRRFTADGTHLTTYSDTALVDPRGMDFDPTTGRLYVASHGTDSIVVFAEDGGFLREIEPADADFVRPTGVFLDSQGDLFVVHDVQGLGHNVFELSTDPSTPNLVLRSFTAGQSLHDVALATDASLFLSDPVGGQILRLDLETGIASTFVGGLMQPLGIALDADAGQDTDGLSYGDPLSQQLLVLDSGLGAVLSFDLEGQMVDIHASPSLAGASGFDVYQYHNVLAIPEPASLIHCTAAITLVIVSIGRRRGSW